MFSPKTPIAALSVAWTLLIGLPALAQGTFAIDPAGNVIDSSGAIVRPRTVVTPMIVPLNWPVATPLATVEPEASLSDRTVTKKTVITTTSPSGWVEDPLTTYTTVRRTELSSKLTDIMDARRVELATQITFINDLPLNMSLRAKLLEIAAKEAALRKDDCLSYEAAISLGQDFDQLSNEIYTLRQTDRLAPLVLTNVNGSRQIAVTDIPM